MRWNAKMLGLAIAVIVALVVLGFVVVQPTSVFGQWSLTIGYVDIQRAIDAHPGKANAEAALRGFAQEQIANALEQMKSMTAAQRQDLQRQLDQAIFKKRAELLGGLDKDIRAAIQRTAKQQGVSIVMTREVMLYGGVNLTDQVIQVIRGK